jgi:hypothetical protein
MSDPRSLFIYYKPGEGCLWVLNPNDVNNDYIPLENRHLAAFSNASVILREASDAPDPTVFGNEPIHDWCYYFEKASLANQQGDWNESLDLMSRAQQENLQPTLGIEWLPLIKAYAMTGDWQAAKELSIIVHTMQSKNDSMLCALWDDFSEMSGGQDAAAQITGIANCDG